MISVADAVRTVIEQTRTLDTETVPLAEVSGRVLAEDVYADTDLPPFDRAQMDGYAVRAADVQSVPARLRLAGEAVAGKGWRGRLQAGEAVRIMTGAPVPEGADSVQQVEVTNEIIGADGSVTVEIERASAAGQFIVPRADEIKKGACVLEAGTGVNAAMTAALASFGYARVRVSKRPRVAVIATGSELVPVSETPAPDQIRDSNSFSLAAYATLAGAHVEQMPLAADDLDSLKELISDAATRADMIVLSGGVSMGRYDFTKPALIELGAEIVFDRVSLRPGKPTVFAKLGGATVFGLPGNPVSVSVTFNLFARTALLQMQGARDATLAEQTATLARTTKGATGRESYLPARLHTDERGTLVAEPLKWGGSSDFVAFTRATALVIIPPDTTLNAGAIVRVAHLPG